MNETEKNTAFLFIPDNSSQEYEKEAIKLSLQNAGFFDDDQEWLVEFFKRPDTFGDPNRAAVFRDDFIDHFEYHLPSIVAKLGKLVQTEKDRQTRLLLLFSLMLDFGPGGHMWFSPNSTPSSHPKWISEFQRQAEFCAKNLNWRKLAKIKESESFNLFDLLQFLFPKTVPLNQIVDLKLLNPIKRSSWSDSDFEDPQQLESWLKLRFKDNEKHRDAIRLDTLLQPFSDFPEGVLENKILGLLNAIELALNSALGLGAAMNQGWQLIAQELIPFLDLLTEKKPDSSEEQSFSLKTWWHLAEIIYCWSMGGLEAELPAELRNRLVESAARHIGILRSILRDTPEVFEEEKGKDSAETVYDFDFYKEAFYILLTLATPWKCLKPLLLAFTGMTVQAVTSDLRAWHEHGDEEKPPYPYSNVARWIAIAMYPQNLRDELDKDPYLQGLREEFAKFCLERLKTKGKKEASSGEKQFTNENFVEPRPVWRQCYVQAVTALRVNPGGRAHRTFFWLSQNDPDETVRDLAKRAHKRIRHLDRKKPNLDEGASPRRPLFEAFWWLRQAHLITLGVAVDQPGAMRTRRRELHRTQEKDDRRNWGRTR